MNNDEEEYYPVVKTFEMYSDFVDEFGPPAVCSIQLRCVHCGSEKLHDISRTGPAWTHTSLRCGNWTSGRNLLNH